MDACKESLGLEDGAWGIEPDEPPPATRAADKTGRRKKREYFDEEESDEAENKTEAVTQQQIVRCFPVATDQRRVLQGCRALVESRYNVQVNPPRKGDTEGRGSVTGAPDDVAEALAELRRLLTGATQAVEPQGNKGRKGKAQGKAQGKNQGKDKGKAQGKAQGKDQGKGKG